MTCQLHVIRLKDEQMTPGPKCKVSTSVLSIAREPKPLNVVDNLGRLFSCVADAAQTIVDFDRMTRQHRQLLER